MRSWRICDKNGKVIETNITLQQAGDLLEKHSGSKIELNTSTYKQDEQKILVQL